MSAVGVNGFEQLGGNRIPFTFRDKVVIQRKRLVCSGPVSHNTVTAMDETFDECRFDVFRKCVVIFRIFFASCQLCKFGNQHGVVVIMR